MAHGFVRTTDDIDLLAQSSKRQVWQQLFESMGFVVHHKTPTFLQFNPPPTVRLPVDLMFVDDTAFERMQAKAERVDLDGSRFGVVSLFHLIALKCHSIVNSKKIRMLKDMEDLIRLVGINGLDLNEPELRAIILKHGNAEPLPKTQASLCP